MISWLHLSDLHCFYDNHTNRKIKDSLISYLHDIKKTINLVIITGDIANQGSYTKDLAEYIKKISESTNCSIENFYSCIGNHDMKRSAIRTSTVTTNLKEYLESHEQLTEEQYDYLFTTGHKIYNDKIKELLPHLGNEIHSFENNLDYSVTILNTCLFSHNREDKANLYILENKFYDTLSNNKGKREGIKINLAIGHHSYDWFNEKQQKRFCHELSDGNVDLYLCGHNHDLEVTELADTQVNQFTAGSIFTSQGEKVCFLVGEFNPNMRSYSMELHSYSFENDRWAMDTNSNRKFINGKFSDSLPRLITKTPEMAKVIPNRQSKTNSFVDFQSVLLEIKKKSKEFIGYNNELDEIKKEIKNIMENSNNGDYLLYHARELYGKSYFCSKLIFDLCFDPETKELNLGNKGIIFVDGKRANSSIRAVEIIREQASGIVGYPIEFDSSEINEDKYQPITEMEKMQRIIYELNKLDRKIFIVIDALNEINTSEVYFLPEVLPVGFCFLVTSNIEITREMFSKRNCKELKGFKREEIQRFLNCNDTRFINQVHKITKGCPKLIVDVADSLKEVNNDTTKIKIATSGKEFFDTKIKEWKKNPILEKLMVVFGVFGYVAPLTLDQLQAYLHREIDFQNIKGEEILEALDTVKNQLLSSEENELKLFKAYYSLFVDRINNSGTAKDLIACVYVVSKWMIENADLFDADILGRFFAYWIEEIDEKKNGFLVDILKVLKNEKHLGVLERIAGSVFVNSKEMSINTLEFFERYGDEIDSERIYRLLCSAYSTSGKKYASLEKLNSLLINLSLKSNHVWAKISLGINLLDGRNVEQNKEEGEKLLRKAVEQGNIGSMNNLGSRLLDGRNVEQNKEEGEKLLRKAVEQNDIVAMNNLSSRLLDGKNVEQNKKEGEKLLREAVEQDSIGAINNLGSRLLDGVNVEQNKEEGEKLLREAVKRGNISAMNYLGSRLLDGENIEQNQKEGEKLLREATKRGSIDVTNNLGLRLLDGRNVEQNKEEGEELLREAVKRGNNSAMNYLGSRLLEGKNIEQNQKEGEKLLREAVRRGSIGAMNNLGLLLLDGRNVEQNKEEGEKLIKQAVKRGSIEAMINLGSRLLEGRNIDRNQKEGEELLREAVKRGSIEAMIKLGSRVLVGENVEQNQKEGEELMREAIKRGNIDAMNYLGSLLLDGINIEQNKEEGEGLIREAVKRGSIEAMIKLGSRVLVGENVEQNPKEGEELIREAVKRGNIDAMNYLGSLLLDGTNIEQNKEEGEKLLREAVRRGSIGAMNDLGSRLLEGEKVEQNQKEGEKLLRRAVNQGSSDAMHMLAFHLYQNNQKKEAANLFYKAAENGNETSEINLAYMIRKGEYPSGKHTLNVEMLLYRHVFIEKPDIFASINYALFRISLTKDDDRWIEAQDVLSNLNIYSKSDLAEAVKWWLDLSNAGDLEGDLVIGWLSKLGLIEDIGGLSYSERFRKALNAEIYIADWVC